VKILLAVPGHLRTVPMGSYCAAALRGLGHEVAVFDSQRRWPDKLLRAAGSPWVLSRYRGLTGSLLVRRARRERPEVFLALFGFDVAEEAVQTLRSWGVVTACWWLNDPFQFPRSLRQAPWYDFYFTNSRGCLADYAGAGVRGVSFLPLAADPEIHRRAVLAENEAATYRSDVCFAGDWSPLRQEWITRLLGEFRVRVWGPWGKKLGADSPIRRVLTDGFFTPGEMVKAFSGAKVVLNLHTWFGKWSHGVNPRLFEAAGVGACQVVDRKDEIPDLYRVPEEVVCFESLEECQGALRYYLARDAEREAVGARAAARTHREHTYAARMRTLLAVIRDGPAGPQGNLATPPQAGQPGNLATRQLGNLATGQPGNLATRQPGGQGLRDSSPASPDCRVA